MSATKKEGIFYNLLVIKYFSLQEVVKCSEQMRIRWLKTLALDHQTETISFFDEYSVLECVSALHLYSITVPNTCDCQNESLFHHTLQYSEKMVHFLITKKKKDKQLGT